MFSISTFALLNYSAILQVRTKKGSTSVEPPAVDTRDRRQRPMWLVTPDNGIIRTPGLTAGHTPIGARVPRECSLYRTAPRTCKRREYRVHAGPRDSA